jgi:hypothetical protein
LPQKRPSFESSMTAKSWYVSWHLETKFDRRYLPAVSQSLPIFHNIVLSTLSFAHGNGPACAVQIQAIGDQLRLFLHEYYDKLHENVISRTVWLQHIQGFQGWGLGEEKKGKWVKYDGLSGNQVLLFMALDAFLGLDAYLSKEAQERGVPLRQRMFCRILEKYSFRGRLAELRDPESEKKIEKEFQGIVKKLKVSFGNVTASCLGR